MALETTAKLWLLLSILRTVWHDGAVMQTAIQSSSFFLFIIWLLALQLNAVEDRVMNLLMISTAVYMSSSQKFHFRKMSCSDKIFQHLTELRQEVSQVQRAERLESKTWDLASIGCKWNCMCFTVAGSTQVCIALSESLQSVPVPLPSSACHTVFRQHLVRRVARVMAPHCSPISVSKISARESFLKTGEARCLVFCNECLAWLVNLAWKECAQLLVMCAPSGHLIAYPNWRY